MFTIIDEAKETIKKGDVKKLEKLCELLRVIEVYYNGDNIPVAEITKATHKFAQKIMEVEYIKLRPYVYQIYYKNHDYYLDVLSEKIELKKSW